jgi:hypothetical protein
VLAPLGEDDRGVPSAPTIGLDGVLAALGLAPPPSAAPTVLSKPNEGRICSTRLATQRPSA